MQRGGGKEGGGQKMTLPIHTYTRTHMPNCAHKMDGKIISRGNFDQNKFTTRVNIPSLYLSFSYSATFLYSGCEYENVRKKGRHADSSSSFLFLPTSSSSSSSQDESPSRCTLCREKQPLRLAYYVAVRPQNRQKKPVKPRALLYVLHSLFPFPSLPPFGLDLDQVAFSVSHLAMVHFA